MSTEPTVLLSLAVSVDGLIADETGGPDWLNPYFTDEMDFAGFMSTVGVIVLGRASYDEAGSRSAPGFGGNLRCVVLTRRPLPDPPPGVEAWGGAPEELISRLKAESTGVIWMMGGGRSAVPYLDAGLVDELDLAMIPVLLGRGTPLFLPRSRRDRLELVKSKAYRNGVVSLRYRIARAA